jgi:hypothetical protein
VHYVLIASHNPENCPTSNAKTREVMLGMAEQIPTVAEHAGVTILSGPFVSREHTSVVVVEAKSGEDLDRFLLESRLSQWNSVRVVPSLPMQEAIEEIRAQPLVY